MTRGELFCGHRIAAQSPSLGGRNFQREKVQSSKTCRLGGDEQNTDNVGMEHHIIPLGIAYHRYGDRTFGIRTADRLHHLYLIGQTGAGKSM